MFPQTHWPRLACECPGVSGRDMGWRCPAAGSGTLSVAMYAWDLLKKVAIIFITSTIVWSQVKQHRGNTALPIQKTGLKIYWAWPCSSEQDPVYPSGSLSHQEASISPLSLSIRGQIDWKPNHRKLLKLITWITALSNSMSHELCHVGPPKMDGSWWRVLTKCGPLEKGMANQLSIALRIPGTVSKGKKI